MKFEFDYPYQRNSKWKDRILNVKKKIHLKAALLCPPPPPSHPQLCLYLLKRNCLGLADKTMGSQLRGSWFNVRANTAKPVEPFFFFFCLCECILQKLKINHTAKWCVCSLFHERQRCRKVLSKQSIGGANHCTPTIACPSNALSPQRLPTPLMSADWFWMHFYLQWCAIKNVFCLVTSYRDFP